MPQPADQPDRRPSTCAQRRAIANSPSPAVSIQPTGAAYRPRGIGSSSRISSPGGRRRAPADRSCRMQQRGEASPGRGRRPFIQSAGDVGGQVGQVGQLQRVRRSGIRRSSATAGQHLGHRVARRSGARRVLGAAEQIGGHRVADVFGPGGPGQHPGGDRSPGPPDQQLRAGPDQAVDGEGPAVRVGRGQRPSRNRSSTGSRSWPADRARARPSATRRPGSGRRRRRPPR